MDGTKESDLTTAVLMYAIRCLAEGDQAALRNMNFGPREIEALREMNLADLYRAESLRAHCLDIVLNRDVYWPMIEHMRRQRESEELQQVLIAADAPLEMMQTLFGLGSPRRYFAFSATVMTRLRNVVGEDGADHRDQNSKVDGTVLQISNPQNSKSGSCSSYICKTTTTEHVEDIKISGHVEGKSSLIYPKRLSGNQRELADRYLKSVPAAVRQPILDELEGRFRSEQKGMKPVYDEMRFLHFLCRASNKGEFVPNLGIKVRDERIEREKVRLRSLKQQEQSLAEAKRRDRSNASGQQQLSELRKSLNLPVRPRTDDDSV